MWHFFFICLSSSDKFFFSHHLGETKLLLCTGMGHDKKKISQGGACQFFTIFLLPWLVQQNIFFLKKLPSPPPDIKWCVPYAWYFVIHTNSILISWVWYVCITNTLHAPYVMWIMVYQFWFKIEDLACYSIYTYIKARISPFVISRLDIVHRNAKMNAT